MSESDGNLSGLASGSDSPPPRAAKAPRQPSTSKRSAPSDASSSPELDCIGCDISSKELCPIAVKKAKRDGQAVPDVRVVWGKTTSRRITTRRGKRVKVNRKTGVYCGLCANIVRKEVKKPSYAKTPKKAAMAAIKKALTRGGSMKEKFKAKVKEAIHQRSGGRSRVTKYKTDVAKRAERVDDIIEPGFEFWELAIYKEEYGDPAEHGAKVRSKKIGKKWRKGVYVQVGKKGVYKCERRHRTAVSKTERRRECNFWMCGSRASILNLLAAGVCYLIFVDRR